RHEAPLGAGRKARATPAAQTRGLDLVDDRATVGLVTQQLLPHLVATDTAIGIERPRALELQRLEHQQVHALRVAVLEIVHFSSSRIVSSFSGVRFSWKM